MAFLPIEIARVVRPIHWIKNLSVFAALIFSGNLFDKILFYKVFLLFIVFSIAASSTYVFNDLLDSDKDKLHPIKRSRPVAKGTLSKHQAFILASLLAGASLFLAYYFLSYLLFLLILGYLLLQASYSLFLKNLSVVDILVIACGFIIRVFAGALIIDAHLSVWFLLCIISVALFLASGKRRAELGILGAGAGTRKSLSRYSIELLDSYVTMFANAAWISWALFTFFESPKAAMPVWLFLAELSKATTINKLLMLTIPVTIFGIMRYQSLIFEARSEAPEKLLLTDKALVSSVIVWILMVVWILYSGISAV